MTFPSIKQLFPILEWAPNYKKKFLAGDLTAGITVGVMLIPQGMAYAMLAGLEPVHGLYAVTIPLLLYAFLGTSRQLAVGPVAMVSLLTAAGIGSLNVSDPEEYLLYAVTLAFLVGLIQFGMGILRLGFVVNFLSHPVISGFTSAAALIIGFSQFKHLLGIDLPRSEHFHETLAAIFAGISETHLLTLGIGVGAIVLMKGSKKIHKAIPAPPLAVLLGILIVAFLVPEGAGVAIVGEVPGGLPSLMFPTFDGSVWGVLLPVAVAISMVGFAESYAVAKTIQGKHKDYKLDANQELLALGAANFGAAFFKGYPITGGFSRTAVNDQAGAKTTLASIISAVVIFLTLLFLTELFYYLPNAVLAAVVIVAVSSLVNYKEAVVLWKKDKSDFGLLILTFLATLFLGIEVGIVGGMLLSLVVVIYRASRPHMARLGRIPGTDIFRNVERFDNLEVPEEILIARIDGPVYFANLEYIQSKLNNWIANQKEKLKLIVLDLETVSNIDSTGAHDMKDWIEDRKQEGYQVHLSGAKGPVRDMLARWGVVEACGENNVFMTIEHCIAKYTGNESGETLKKLKDFTLQSI